jgi:hypothetical protein
MKTPRKAVDRSRQGNLVMVDLLLGLDLLGRVDA